MKPKSIFELFKTFLQIAANSKKEYLKSFISGAMALFLQGFFYVWFYFLFLNLLEGDAENSLVCLAVLGALGVAFCVLKFMSTHYDRSEPFIDALYDLRSNLARKLTAVPLQSVHRYKTGELNAVFSSGVDDAVKLINVLPLIFLEPIIAGAIALCASLFFAPQLALLMLLGAICAAFLYKLKRKISAIQSKELAAANARLESQILEYAQGLGVLRAINQTGDNALNLKNATDEVRNLQLKCSADIPGLVLGSLTAILICLSLFLGVYLYLLEEISLAVLAASLVILFAKVKEILQLEELKFDEPLSKPGAFDVKFENVNFAYENASKPSLKNINFHLPSGSLTALVGASGSGKTTITRLIMRYADANAGDIKIGGVNIKNMSQKELLKLISVVFQDVYIFEDSVINNIKMSANASLDEVRAAAKSANCEEFIERLPHGYDTVLKSGRLSGGEAQRISIARAILKDAPIIILDEPTAALDTSSEAAVQKAISKLVKNKTVIVAAHRLSTIASADQILVFDGAEIIQHGTHEQLIAADGKYRQMWQASQNVKSWRINP